MYSTTVLVTAIVLLLIVHQLSPREYLPHPPPPLIKASTALILISGVSLVAVELPASFEHWVKGTLGSLAVFVETEMEMLISHLSAEPLSLGFDLTEGKKPSNRSSSVWW